MIRRRVARLVYRLVRLYIGDTPPYEVVRDQHNPEDYLHRWWVFPRNRFFNIYIHKFLRSDDDRALHDHPWWNVSYILDGWYYEHTDSGRELRITGDIVFRPAELRHRIELITGFDRYPEPVWTLFIRGRKTREWGFWCPQGFKHWRPFVDDDGC